MNARLLRPGRWLLGLLVLVSGVSHAVDCPTAVDGQTIVSGWPTGSSPTAVWTNAGGGIGWFGVSNFSIPSDSVQYASWGAARSAMLAWAQAYRPDLSFAITNEAYIGNAGAGWHGNAVLIESNNGQYKMAGSGRTGVVNASCSPPAPPQYDCSLLANVKTLGSANDQPDSFVPGDTICVKNGNVGGAATPLNCAAFKLSTQKWHRMGPINARDHLVRYQFTGLACDQEPQQTATDPMDTDHEGERCTSSNGLNFCTGKDYKEGCGFFNDKYVCVESLDKGNCETKADGSRLCGSTAPTPPVPDNGTPGNPAAPDSTMEVCTGQGTCTQYNYYNSTTAQGSSRDPGAGGNTDGSGTVGPGGTPAGTGDGTEGEDPTADDSASGGATCDAAPTCEGDPIACAVLAQQWRTRCTANPTDADLEASFGPVQNQDGSLFGTEERDIGSFDTSGWMGGGACVDDYTVNMGSLIGTYTIPFSELCELLQFVGMFVMVSAYVGGAKIILGGV